MLDIETRLFVFHDDDGTFIDFSNDAQDYGRDKFAVEMIAAEDNLYIGFRKPVNSLYVEMNTPNTEANTLSIKYFKDTAFSSLSPVSDETKGLTRSGFILWGRNLVDEVKTTVNGQEAFWYQIKVSADHSATTKIQAINSVFSDDNDLRSEIANIDSYRVSTASSHILSHVSARDAIMQDLRNSGRIKLNVNTGRFKDLNIFDVLNIEQLREASKWKTLSIIFDDVSDKIDDKYDQRARKYNTRYKAVMNNLQFLGLDVDDDGKADISEEQASITALILRR
jgi:hypothetical protein